MTSHGALGKCMIRLWLTNVNLSPRCGFPRTNRRSLKKKMIPYHQMEDAKNLENVGTLRGEGWNPGCFLGGKINEILDEINESNDRNYPWREFMTCVWFSFFTIGFYPKTHVVVVSIESTSLLERTSPNSILSTKSWLEWQTCVTYSKVQAFQDGCIKSEKWHLWQE